MVLSTLWRGLAALLAVDISGARPLMIARTGEQTQRGPRDLVEVAPADLPPWDMVDAGHIQLFGDWPGQAARGCAEADVLTKYTDLPRYLKKPFSDLKNPAHHLEKRAHYLLRPRGIDINQAVNEEFFWDHYVRSLERSDALNNADFVGTEWGHEEDFVTSLRAEFTVIRGVETEGRSRRC